MEEKNAHMQKKNYRNLALMSALSFISMYLLMYSMVNTIGNVLNNFNQAYMAAIMTAPMVIFGILIMRSMYTNQRLNLIIISISLIALVVFFLFIRQQTAIGDKQFLRSMIPHHSSAILMCERSSIENPEIQELCQEIIASQQAEIDQMRTILQELE